VIAVAELSRENGLLATTVSMVCRTARMSRGTFYSHFSGIKHCWEYSFAEAFDLTFGSVRPLKSHTSPEQALRSSLATLFSSIAAEPVLTELCLTHSFSAPAEAGANGFEGATEVVQGLLRVSLGSGSGLAAAEECLARSILSEVSLRVRQGRADDLLGREAAWAWLAQTRFAEPGSGTYDRHPD
jgi:AcrR family transcriptional regulator